MTLRTDAAAGISEKRSVSRRRFLAAASTGIAGSTIADSALADTLTDVPPRVMKCTRETDGIAMRSSTVKTRGLCTIP